VLEGLEDRVLLSGSPTIYTVDLTSDNNTGSGTTGDLLYCITQANGNPNAAGSEIQFDPMVFSATTPQPIKLASTLNLYGTAGPEVIEGLGASVVTISGNNAVEVLSVAPGVTATLSGLTITGGSDPNMNGAGGIFNQGTLTLTDSTVSDNVNEVMDGESIGGGLNNRGTLTITNSMISGNSAAADGGGVYNGGGAMTVTNSTIANNKAGQGGGMWNVGTLTIANTKFSGNKAEGYGSSGPVGGGIENHGGARLSVSGGTFASNSANSRSGGGSGGGINNSGTAAITGSRFSANSARYGGGISVAAGALTLSAASIADNKASISGGGIINGGINGAFINGSISKGGEITAVDCTIALNSAAALGGGIQSEFAMTAVNCTIVDNSAGDRGGGIASNGPGMATLTNCTIAYNTASNMDGGGSGGGLTAEANGVATLDNTIVALNTDNSGAPSDVLTTSGGTLSAASAYNLIGTGGAGGLTSSNGNQVGVATPGLGALADNGGPTQTIALRTGSPAIDAGSNALAVDPRTGQPLLTDQRGTGFPRIANGTVDIGAYEAGNPTGFTVDLTTDSGASTSLDEGDLLYCITQANAQGNPSGSVIGFDPTIFTTPQTITLSSTLALSDTHGPEVIDGPGANLVTVSGNAAVAVLLVDSGVTATLSGLTIADGMTSADGGGVVNEGNLTVTNCTISGNSSSSDVSIGGGIFNDGAAKLTVNDSTIAQNDAGDFGGGIGSYGTVTVNDSTLSQNSCREPEGGGGIGNINGHVTVNDSTLSDNSGGGVWETGGMLRIRASTVKDNSGAGISAPSGGSVSVTGSTISDNNSNRGRGGGIMVSGGGALTIANSTITGNSASGPGGGIGVSGQAVIVNSTIALNNVTGSGGGGLYVGTRTTATLDNTIVALNTHGTGAAAPEDDIASLGSLSGSYNLIGTGGSGGLTNGTNGNQVGVVNPGLAGALANNGGPTQTIALLPGSPAIDAGSAPITGATVPGIDQRGFPRIGGNDIGAFQAGVPVPTTTYVNSTWADDAPGTMVTWTDGSTHYVGYDAFGTVQAGVNAVAAGGTVNVAAGTYTEQVAITQSLTLAGAGTPGTTIQAPASLSSDDEVAIASGNQVALAGFTVAGASAATGVGDNGGTLTATGVTVRGFLTGVAVQDQGTATITDSALAHNQRGIVVGASASDTCSVTASDDDLSSDQLGIDSIQSGVPVSATGNWWGSLHGPESSANPGGDGVPAGSNVTFSPWIGVYTSSSVPGQPGFEPTAITLYALPTRFVFSTEPSSTATAGSAIAAQPVVEAEDAGGNLGINFDSATVTGSQVSLTVSAGTLAGTTTVDASGGAATFSGVTITQPGTYTLTASALGSAWSGLSAATSMPITVSTPTPTPTRTPTPAPTPTPTPTPALITAVVPVFDRKTHKNGKPVLTGFVLDFNAPLDPAAASSPANYQIDTVTTRKVKKTVQRILHPISNFTVSYTPANHAVALTLAGNQTFPTGGQITVSAGVTSNSRGVFEGTTEFSISKGAKRVVPGGQ
jgi:hypothetical protein